MAAGSGVDTDAVDRIAGHLVDPWESSDPHLPHLAGYVVKRVPGFQARKGYRCPACHGDIAPGVGHVVAWPDAQAEDRRHWHTHCWRIASRRGRIA